MQIDHGIAAAQDAMDGGQPGRDYALVRRAIAFLTAHRDDQPGLDRLSEHLGVSATHAQRTFKRWCGLSPKEFVQALTAEYARGLLAEFGDGAGGGARSRASRAAAGCTISW